MSSSFPEYTCINMEQKYYIFAFQLNFFLVFKKFKQSLFWHLEVKYAEWLQKASFQFADLVLYLYDCELSINKEENITWAKICKYVVLFFFTRNTMYLYKQKHLFSGHFSRLQFISHYFLHK